MNLFKKKSTLAQNKKNWYVDQYQTAVVQRNFLAVITLVSLVGVIISVIAVSKISTSKSIEPFVIEIEEKTGITNVIRPLIKEDFSYNETLRRYFIMRYLNARETYDFNSFQHNYFKVVRLMSNKNVYSEFKKQVYVQNPKSPVRLGENLSLIHI